MRPLLPCALSLVVGLAFGAGCGEPTPSTPTMPSTPAPSTSSSAPPTPTATDLAPMLEEIRGASGLPALGAAVIDSKGLVAIGVTGTRKLGGTVAVTRADPWHLGSDTKAMTATLVARLAEKGETKLDATVAQLFPGATVHERYRDVTLLDLLRHRGGAPADVPAPIWSEMWKRPTDSRDARKAAVLALLATEPTVSRGTYTYSNAGYMIAGAALETRVSWEDALTAEVFEPLGMKGCAFGPQGKKGAEDAPLAHREEAGAYVPVEPGPTADNPRSLGPAGTVSCPIEGWIPFLSAHLKGARGESGYLTEASWKILHEPAPAASGEPAYAAGWIVANPAFAKGQVLAHDGSNTMNYASAYISPSLDRAILVVTNAGGPKAAKAVADTTKRLFE